MRKENSLIRAFLLIVLFLFTIAYESSATHNRAGEITYVQIDELTIRATITTYTKTSSFSADRDSVELFWGDGTSEFVTRANGGGDPLENDIKINFYIAEHSYPSRGTYTMGMTDPNRVAGILNVDFPNSVNIQFYIETTFSLLNTQFQGENNSVILLQPPIDIACVGEVFVHNPNGYDPDGDSLSYELAVPFQSVGLEVPNYLFPDELSPGSDNVLTLDPVTGELIWDSPKNQGEVNITIRINEYREGVLINSMVRDMQVSVSLCMDDPNPPTLETPGEICVVAGEKVVFEVFSDDTDKDQFLRLSATGGPFILENSPATFFAPELPFPPVVRGVFEWQTNCDHVNEEFYQIVFKSVDNSLDRVGAERGLAALKTVRIKVVAPPPENLNAKVDAAKVVLTWDSPYDCEVTTDDFFRGFTVWRRNNSTEVPLDTCITGLEGHGYEKIIFFTKEIKNGRYTVTDDDVERGNIYCYRVLAEFSKLSALGNPFNIVESIRSEESCVELLQDRPLITKVSVENTDVANGRIEVNWVLPVAEDVDTIANPGPYELRLLRSEGLGTNSFVEIATFPFTSFGEEVASTHSDPSLNTRDQAYTYRMDFFANNEQDAFSRSSDASSVFLNTAASDNLIRLSWDENVPWSNFEYVIFKKQPGGDFDSIGTTASKSFTDSEVLNDMQECYKVMTIGTYNIQRVPGLLTNFSQENCAIPLDTVAPCSARLNVSNLCDNLSRINDQDFANNLRWELETNCKNAEDLKSFNVYYAEFEGSDFVLTTNADASNSSFIHRPDAGISGCYAITSLDTLGNESAFSNIVCLDNCPRYELPNTFTPNDDQANDLFTPRINRFIERVDMEIYNKWGQIVYRTENPAINWDGRTNGGKELAEGSYYYKARVFERRLTGIFEQQDIRVGYIDLIR